MLYVKDEGLGGFSGYTGGSLGMFSQFILTLNIHSITDSESFIVGIMRTLRYLVWSKATQQNRDKRAIRTTTECQELGSGGCPLLKKGQTTEKGKNLGIPSMVVVKSK